MGGINFTSIAGNYAIDKKGWYYQKGTDGKWHPLRAADQTKGKNLFEQAKKAEQNQPQKKPITGEPWQDNNGRGTKWDYTMLNVPKTMSFEEVAKYIYKKEGNSKPTKEQITARANALTQSYGKKFADKNGNIKAGSTFAVRMSFNSASVNGNTVADELKNDIVGLGTSSTFEKNIKKINENNAAQVIQAYNRQGDDDGEDLVHAIDNEALPKFGKFYGTNAKIEVYKHIFNQLKSQIKNNNCIEPQKIEEYQKRFDLSLRKGKIDDIALLFTELSQLYTDKKTGFVNNAMQNDMNIRYAYSDANKFSRTAQRGTNMLLGNTISESVNSVKNYYDNEHGISAQIWGGCANIFGSKTSPNQISNDMQDIIKSYNALKDIRDPQKYAEAFEKEFVVEFNPVNMARVEAYKKQLEKVEGFHYAEQTLQNGCSLLLSGNRLIKEESVDMDSNRTVTSKQTVFNREFNNYVAYLASTTGEKKANIEQRLNAELNQYKTLDEKWKALQNAAIQMQKGLHSELMKATNGVSYEQYTRNVDSAYSIAFGDKGRIMHKADAFIASQRAGEGYVKMVGKIGLTITVGALTGGVGAAMLVGAGTSLAIDTGDELSRGVIASDNKLAKIQDNAEKLLKDPHKIGEILTEAAVAGAFIGEGALASKITMQTLKSAGLRFTALAANDVAFAAGVEKATTGTVSVEGMIFALAFSSTGHLVGIKQLTRKGNTNTGVRADSAPKGADKLTTEQKAQTVEADRVTSDGKKQSRISFFSESDFYFGDPNVANMDFSFGLSRFLSRKPSSGVRPKFKKAIEKAEIPSNTHGKLDDVKAKVEKLVRQAKNRDEIIALENELKSKGHRLNKVIDENLRAEINRKFPVENTSAQGTEGVKPESRKRAEEVTGTHEPTETTGGAASVSDGASAATATSGSRLRRAIDDFRANRSSRKFAKRHQREWEREYNRRETIDNDYTQESHSYNKYSDNQLIADINKYGAESPRGKAALKVLKKRGVKLENVGDKYQIKSNRANNNDAAQNRINTEETQRTNITDENIGDLVAKESVGNGKVKHTYNQENGTLERTVDKNDKLVQDVYKDKNGNITKVKEYTENGWHEHEYGSDGRVKSAKAETNDGAMVDVEYEYKEGRVIIKDKITGTNEEMPIEEFKTKFGDKFEVERNNSENIALPQKITTNSRNSGDYSYEFNTEHGRLEFIYGANKRLKSLKLTTQDGTVHTLEFEYKGDKVIIKNKTLNETNEMPLDEFKKRFGNMFETESNLPVRQSTNEKNQPLLPVTENSSLFNRIAKWIKENPLMLTGVGLGVAALGLVNDSGAPNVDDPANPKEVPEAEADAETKADAEAKGEVSAITDIKEKRAADDVDTETPTPEQQADRMISEIDNATPERFAAIEQDFQKIKDQLPEGKRAEVQAKIDARKSADNVIAEIEKAETEEQLNKLVNSDKVKNLPPAQAKRVKDNAEAKIRNIRENQEASAAAQENSSVIRTTGNPSKNDGKHSEQEIMKIRQQVLDAVKSGDEEEIADALRGLRAMGPFKGRKNLRRLLKNARRLNNDVLENNYGKKYLKHKEKVVKYGNASLDEFKLKFNDDNVTISGKLKQDVQRNMDEQYEDLSDKKKAKVNKKFGLL